MEHAKSGESSASGGEESNAKRHRGDVNPNFKSVVVLLDSDVTVSENGQVFMPNTIEMAKLKKPKKGQYRKITFTSEMTKEDVLITLHCNFPILREKRRLCCASAVENRTRLEFHGEPRLWNGALIKKLIRGNSALYLLAEGSRESEESQVLPIGTVSVAATRPLNVNTSVAGPSQQKKPVLIVPSRQKDLSVPAAYSMNSATQMNSIPLKRCLGQDMTARKRTAQWRSFSQQSTTVSTSKKQENGTSSFATFGSPGCIKSAENLTFQAMQLRFTSSATSAGKSSLQVRGLASEPSVNEDSMTTPVQHHCQADFSMPTSVAQGSVLAAIQRLKELSQISATADQGHLTGKGDALHALVSNANHLSALRKTQNDPVVQTISDPAAQESPKPVSTTSGSQQRELNACSSEQGLSPLQQVLPATYTEKLSENEGKRKSPPHGHQENSVFRGTPELIRDSGESQQPTHGPANQEMIPPAENDEQAQIANFAEGFKSAEKADKVGRYASNWTDIETPSKTINMSEEEFDSALEDAKDVMLEDIDWFQDDCQSQKEVSMSTDVHQKELTAQTSEQQVEAISNTKTVDSGVESTGEDHTSVDHDNGQSQDLIQLHDSWAYTKTRKKILIVLRDPLPKDVISHDANFQDFGNVNLDKINPYNLSCLAPESQNPGVKQVKLVLTFANGSCEVGSTKFTYIDRENEAVEVLLKNKEMWPDLFIKCGEQMKNEHIGSQTSDHSGVTEAGSSSLSENTNAWSVKVLKDLVYKAAQVGGLEFIKTIFTTSAGKVVFSNYKDSATLPEDVARANGHTTLADYLQDLNNRLAKEGSSDTGTETIDWLELKRAVDTEQGLPCTDDAQMLKNCQPQSPESDYNGSDYLADDEMSVCSSPSHSEVSDTEHEDRSQNTIRTESWSEKEVNEEINLPVEKDDSSLLPLHLVGNQLEVIPCMKDENAWYEHKQLDSDEEESHRSEDDINEKEYECTGFKTDQNELIEIAVPCGGEVVNWDTLGSEEISTIKEASTGTTSSHTAALPNISSHQETDDVVETNGSETGLDGDQKEFKMIDNDEISRSRDISVGEESSSSCSTRELPCSSELRDARRSFFAGISRLWLALTERLNAKYWSVESLESTVESLVCTESLDSAVESLDSTIESLDGAVESLDGAVESLDDIRSRDAESGKLKAGSPIDSEIFEFPVSCKEPCKTVHIEDEITDGRNTEKPRDYNKKNSSISNKSTVSEISRMMSNIPENVDAGMGVWGLMDHNGGKLTIGNTGVSLTVLPEAIPEGRTEVIYIAIIDREKEHPQVTSKESLLSPIVKCGPAGLQFQCPVILSMPHCALFEEGAWNLKGEENGLVSLAPGNHGKTCSNDVIASVLEGINWKGSFIKLAKKWDHVETLHEIEAKASDLERRLWGLRERSQGLLFTLKEENDWMRRRCVELTKRSQGLLFMLKREIDRRGRIFVELAKKRWDHVETLHEIEAKTSDLEQRLGGLGERSRASDRLFSEWAEMKFHLVPGKGKQNFPTAVVKGTKNSPVLGTTGGPIYQVECEEKIEQKEHSPTSLTPNSILPVDSSVSKLWPRLLDDCSEVSVVHLLSCHFFSATNPKSALYFEEQGRATALADLMAAQYSIEMEISGSPRSWTHIEEIMKKECNSTCLYISYYGQEVFLWILKTSGAISLHKITVENNTPHTRLATNLDAVFAIMANNICNDQSVHGIEPKPDSSQILTWLYKLLIDPVSGLLEEPSIIIVPEGALCLVPFAALLDDESGKYLSETFRIRVVPSLTTLKLIQDSPPDYHSQTGALVVGDPDVGEVIYRGRLHKKFVPLPGARKEAEMIGRLLGVQPLLGQHATKQAVLQRIKSVSLIHVAAHGNAERGEIALAPLDSTTEIPQEDDYLLKMSDISQVQLRAKLVVLSCCHSGRGQIRSEGIIGMAQAFLGYGARSVLVALGALNDRATEQLMSRFYQHLVRGESASESLHQAMKWMRGNGFTKVSDWAPFTLIGDDVTFDFGK